jgi:hypothetical protein
MRFGFATRRGHRFEPRRTCVRLALAAMVATCGFGGEPARLPKPPVPEPMRTICFLALAAGEYSSVVK